MKTLEIPMTKCDCGCEGDLLVEILDGIIQFMICKCCGQKIEITQEES